jgi:hypothetical protein
VLFFVLRAGCCRIGMEEGPLVQNERSRFDWYKSERGYGCRTEVVEQPTFRLCVMSSLKPTPYITAIFRQQKSVFDRE